MPRNSTAAIFCRKMQKMSDLLTFNTGAAEIYANVKKNANINTFIKIGGRMKIYTYQGKKNVSGEKIQPDEEYETDVAICAGSKNAGGRSDAGA